MKMRATRGSFTWQGRRVKAGQTLEVAGIPDATLAALKRLYGLEEAQSARGRRTRQTQPKPEPVEVVEQPDEQGAEEDG